MKMHAPIRQKGGLLHSERFEVPRDYRFVCIVAYTG